MIGQSAVASEASALAQQSDDILEAAVREHSRLVYRIAFSVLRNPADAEDAAQETFLRVLRHGRKLARVQDQKAWLARIAWRVVVERRRLSVRSSARTEEASAALPSRALGADRLLLEQERSAILSELVASLPEPLQQALVLSSIEEIAPREAAIVLGISEAAVRSRAFRARQILRSKLSAVFGGRK